MSKLVLITCVITITQAAKILIVVPTPSISHQVVFRPIATELLKRGHEVTHITTDPVYPKGKVPENYTQIDLHDISYNEWRKEVGTGGGMTQGNNVLVQMQSLFDVMTIIFFKQIEHPEIKKILSNETHFDLLILEAWMKPLYLFSHINKNAPVILSSSLGGMYNHYDMMGAPSRPYVLYTSPLRKRLGDLTLFEKLNELYTDYMFELMINKQTAIDDVTVKNILGPNTPTISELEKNVDMLFLNVHPIWEMNRPVPPSILYTGGVHQNPSKELPQVKF